MQNFKPIFRDLRRATRRLHKFHLGGPADAGEPDGIEEVKVKILVSGAMEGWMQPMVKADTKRHQGQGFQVSFLFRSCSLFR